MPSITDLPILPVVIDADGARLHGDLGVPMTARGLIIFAHGSGSSRRSARNRRVAEYLWSQGFGTLLLDLLTPDEEGIDRHTSEHRFNIALLARRLEAAIDWAARQRATAGLPIGLFGASTGAAAALVAAAARPLSVRAVVSRGGRPDLASAALGRVKAPTLLVVGGADHEVIGLNRQAYRQLACDRHLEIVPGATHLFEEAGALEEVARLASAWFDHHLAGAQTS